MLNLIRTNSKQRNAMLVVVALVAILFAAFARGGTTTASARMLSGITCEAGQWQNSKFFSGDSSNCPDIVELLFKPAFVNEKTSEFFLRFVTFPAGMYGSAMKNSGWVSEPYYVDVDSSDSSRIYNRYGSTSQGATLKAKMGESNALFYYPFDRYTGEIKTQATAEQSKLPIPIDIVVADSTLSGWKLNFYEKGKANIEESEKILYVERPATLFWTLSRANVVFLSVSVLIFLMVIALGSAFAITRSISQFKRPPSMNLLLWLATILFAILQVRTNFPGNPPIGILLDFIVVFPVLGLLLILGIANTFYWLNRSDWDFENENPELLKNV